MSYLIVKDIKKNFDKKAIAQLHGVSFEVEKGHLISIIGPSGTGKTTLFKAIAGEIDLDDGQVTLNGSQIKRVDLAFLSSINDLNPRKNVIENIMFGLHETSLHEDDKLDLARDMIEVFGLEYKDKKRLEELSAGQLQRVRLARAIIKKPKLLLLDEPFTNLDEFLKAELMNELLEILEQREITTVLITHHLQEAFSLSNKILFLANGKVIQYDTPENIYKRPIDVFTARFTGDVNLVASNLVNIDRQTIHLKNPYGEYKLPNDHGDRKKFLYLACRAEDIVIDEKGEVSGKVIRSEYRGAYYSYRLRTGEKNPVIFNTQTKLELGQRIRVSLKNGFTLPI